MKIVLWREISHLYLILDGVYYYSPSNEYVVLSLIINMRVHIVSGVSYKFEFLLK